MRIHCERLDLRTESQFQVIDVTPDVEKAVINSGLDEGSAVVYSRHTTCGLIINEREHGLLADFRARICDIVPDDGYFMHDDFDIRTENMHPDETKNGSAHLRQLVGGSVSQTIPFSQGQLLLGEWQRVMVIEFDRPREREIIIQVSGS